MVSAVSTAGAGLRLARATNSVPEAPTARLSPKRLEASGRGRGLDGEQMDGTRDEGSRRRASPLLLGAVAALLALVPTAGAHDAGRSDEHGFLTLEFEENGDVCDVSLEARQVDASEVTLQIARPQGPSGLVADHEEELTGTPEPDGEGFRYASGPHTLAFNQTWFFILAWEGHEMHRVWSSGECAPIPLFRVHQDPQSGAVTEVQGCSFFVEGRYMRDPGTSIEVSGLFRDDASVTPVPEDAVEPDDPVGERFFVGPVEVEESGRFSVVLVGDGDRSGAHTFTDVAGCSDEPPECPSGVEVETGDGSNHLRWDPVQGALEYRIYRGEDGGQMVLRGEEQHPVNLHHDAVEPGTDHTYRITAVGEVGESEGCPIVRVTTPGELPEEPEEPACPPVALTATANADGSILVSAAGLTGDAVLTRSDGGEALQVASLDEAGAGFLDAETEVGTTYTYTLLADGVACASVQVTAIPVFPSLAAGGLAVAASALGYVVVRRRR